MLSTDDVKKQVGEYAAQFVKSGMTIGIGTGSTAYWVILSIAARIKEGLQCRAVPTSEQTRKLAAEQGIPLLELNDVEALDLTIDGADEIDPQLRLIKGGGGALLQEKMVATASVQLIIIADQSKLVQQLGAFPLPVEVIPFGWKQVQRHILQTGCSEVVLRSRNGQPFITDHGHYILDCHFKIINDPTALNIALHSIPGVVETGLFINLATTAVVGDAEGQLQILSAQRT